MRGVGEDEDVGDPHGADADVKGVPDLLEILEAAEDPTIVAAGERDRSVLPAVWHLLSPRSHPHTPKPRGQASQAANPDCCWCCCSSPQGAAG